MLSERLNLLQRMPIFGAIREDTLEFLLAEARVLVVRRGEYFFREHEPAQAMYVLEVGDAVVLKSWEGVELPLHQLAAGDCFGEMALMDLQPRSASVRALQDCSAIELAIGNLYRLFGRDLEQFTLIQMNIGREVCRRLRAADEQLFQARIRAG